MNYGALIIIGVFITMTVSWYSFVLAPFKRVGGQPPHRNGRTGDF
jgi:hypothetical protein